MECVDLGGDVLDVDRACCDCTGCSGADEKTFSSNGKEDWYGLPDAALEASEAALALSFFERPPQLSLML